MAGWNLIRMRAKSLMLQGTSSYAGKSLLTAALGRILLQDGVAVAPFKSQNMSLNSFVTLGGGEMGRAQVLQAQACGLEPDVRMNPVLLKPMADTCSQVIVQGKPKANMNVAEYFAYQPQAFKIAKACYDSLAADYEVILLEGAGSPGEVNLRKHDIVNMPMAAHAQAPVLIVGDIDRGGVFASFVGTNEVLLPHEKQRIAGWVVNKFRGDAGLLKPAFNYMRRRTGKPVLGVVPYIHDLMLPEEDGVDLQAAYGREAVARDCVEIAVIELPHISNFTDLDALRGEKDVKLRMVRSAADLQQPDAVIIPGSKNTLADLAYLRQKGLAQRLLDLAAGGHAEIIGICAGFQMLGKKILDTHALESRQRHAPGLGLLDLETEMYSDKILTRTTARHTGSGLLVSGYEIHHGRTKIPADSALFIQSDGRALGAARMDQRIWGTYLHGVFDADKFRRWFIDRLRARRGLAPHSGASALFSLEPALDRLAAIVRQNVRMDRIYKLLGI